MMIWSYGIFQKLVIWVSYRLKSQAIWTWNFNTELYLEYIITDQ